MRLSGQVTYAPDGPAPTAEPTPAPAQAPESASAAAPSPEPSEPTPVDILNFDPFENPIEPEPAPPTGAESQSAPVQPEPTPTSGSDIVAQLAAQQAELIAALTPKVEEPAPAAEPDNYFADVQIPPALLAAVRSEDPQESAAALNLVVQGTANLAFKKMQGALGEFIQRGLPQILQNYQSHVQTATDVRKDFYGTYPQLDKPELAPLVTNVTQQVVAEMGPAFKGTWSLELRDKVAERVIGLLSGFQPKPAEPPRVPFNPTPATRMEEPSDVSSDIMATLFGA